MSSQSLLHETAMTHQNQSELLKPSGIATRIPLLDANARELLPIIARRWLKDQHYEFEVNISCNFPYPTLEAD
jgi:hypothetical protein